MKTKYEEGPDQYERDMAIFDEEMDGMASIPDVKRVMKDLAGMNDDDIALFIKKCVYNNLTEEQRAMPIEQMQLPESFEIRQSAQNLYNI